MKIVFGFMLLGMFMGLGACSASATPTKVGSQPSWRTSAEARDTDGSSRSSKARPLADPVSASASSASSASVTSSTSSAAPVVFAPQGPSVTVYNEPFKAFTPESPLYQGILAAMDTYCRDAGVRPPVADPRLFKAADDMARVVPENRPLAYSIIEFSLQRHGIIEPSPHMVPVAGDLDAPESMLAKLAERLPGILGQDAITRVGIGSARGDGPGRDVLVLLLQDSHVAVDPMPREVHADGHIDVNGKALSDYRDPEVFVTRDDGMVVRHDIKRRGKQGFRTRVSCAGQRGRQQIEITAVNDQGATVLANFPVWCGTSAPGSITVHSSIDDLVPVKTPTEAEDLMLRLVNRDRQAYGLPPLALSVGAGNVARAHSREMRDTGLVAHVSPTTGSAPDRVLAANISTSLVMENIARAYGVGEAQAGLMASPGHRTNLMSDKATHIGIGIAFQETEAEGRIMFFTQVFIRVPPRLSGQDARDRLRDAIDERKSAGHADELSAVAQAYADEVIAADKPNDEAAAWRAKAFQPLHQRYAKSATAVVAVTDLETIDLNDAFNDPWITHYGVGVAEGRRDDSGQATLFVVLVLAEAR